MRPAYRLQICLSEDIFRLNIYQIVNIVTDENLLIATKNLQNQTLERVHSAKQKAEDTCSPNIAHCVMLHSSPIINITLLSKMGIPRVYEF